MRAAGIWVMAAMLLAAACAGAETRPNILWLSTEDMSAHLGCYGDPDAITPNIDRLAAEGVRFTRAYTAAPVCAPNRASIITGLYQTTLGSMHMRSTGEGKKATPPPALPAEVRCFPEYLRRAGYYCTNNEKQDYNFGPTPPESWDESSATAHWKDRADSKQPFFAVFNYMGTHESQVRLKGAALDKMTGSLSDAERHDPAKITVPPYQPDTPVVRRQWANVHDLVTTLDHWVAKHLKDLEEAGLAENTVVMFWSDHGTGLPRHKRWLYDSGTHVPLIVRVPKALQASFPMPPGTTDDRLISSIDLAPTVLALAGVALPGYLQGQPFMGANQPAPRQYVFSARDRMDERHDTIRSVRDARYRYIRNFQTWVPYSQYIDYCERGDVQKELRRMAAEGTLPEGCRWFGLPEKPVEELYDMESDPHSLNNLAADPPHQATLLRLRGAQLRWIRETRDLGFLPEPELVRLEKKYGSRYEIHAGMAKDFPGFWEDLYTVSEKAGAPVKDDSGVFTKYSGSPHAAIRYWVAINLREQGVLSRPAQEWLAAAREDVAPEVRIAAAEALLRHGADEAAQIALLAAALADEDMWVRVAAAAALDRIGEKARPAISALQEALNDQHNKYIVRLANHALNQLLGASNEVP